MDNITRLLSEIQSLKKQPSVNKESLNALFSIAGELESENAPLPSFTLQDDTGHGDVTGNVNNVAHLGLAIHVEGYGEYSSQDDQGAPVYIEKYDGELRVLVYADINQEDPTHVVCLEGARLDKRSA